MAAEAAVILPKEKVEEMSKVLVQEISQRGYEIPEKYLHKDGLPEAIDIPADLYRGNLVIDFSLLFSSSSPAASVAELAKLRSALSDWGFFQVINHGIERSMRDEVIEVTKQFFGLPLEEKLKWSGEKVFQGYGNDSVYIKSKAGNWNDRLFLHLLPEDGRLLHFWPDNPFKFREIVHEVSLKMKDMMESIFKAMAMSLNLKDTECFLKKQGKQGSLSGRFSYYPSCPRPERVLGVKPHSDGSVMTALLVDKDVEGLHILKDDQWFKVPILSDAVFINLGDLGEGMSNGIFKSVIHRVATNSETSRASAAFFYNPDWDVEIEAVSELITEDRPQMYKKFSINEFRQAVFKNYSKPLDAFLL